MGVNLAREQGDRFCDQPCLDRSKRLVLGDCLQVQDVLSTESDRSSCATEVNLLSQSQEIRIVLCGKSDDKS